MGLNPLDAPVDVTIACWEWGAYLGEEGKRNGVRAKVSSWRRISPDSLIPHAKASGQYLNSVLAKIESVKAGYEEAILLDDHGHVCEGSGENIYVVRDGEIVTPPPDDSILDGITRRSVIQIARDLGYEVVERDIARAELYLADEVFLTGTAAELVPVREIDDHAIGTGEPGEITRVLQAAFDDALHGRTERYREWLDVGRRAAALETPDRASARAERAAARRASAPRRARPAEWPRRSELYDATLRDGMGGGGLTPDRRGEAARRARARRARRRPDRGRLPGVEPQGAASCSSCSRGERSQHARDRRVRDDPPPRRRRRRGRGAARARRVLRAGLHARRQDLVAARREGRARLARGEPAR